MIQRKGEIELQLDVTGKDSGVVNVYTLQGQLLYTRTFTGERNLIISTSGFPNGSYIVQVKDNNTKKSWGRKVVNLN
ncbi:hypothetical protein FACS1894123_07990 [Bacteroidia bacterium]|nr:hypothetical protein FACS1894123_07990 [Bacteroidia bacterium]